MDLERDTIVKALHAAKGNIGKAAKALGASRRTLQNRMREYGMPRGKPGRRHRRLPYARKRSKAAWLLGGAAAIAGVLFLRKRGRRA